MEDRTVEYDDGIVSVFLNTTGDRAGIDDKLVNVLEYIKTGESNDDYTEELKNRVQEMNRDDDWRNRHMTLKMKLEQVAENSYDKGYMDFAFQAVSNGNMNLNVAADMLKMSEEEFEKAMVEAGYKVPVA